jgi:hypothetical protein
MRQTDLGFQGKTVARHFERTGSALVRPVRAEPVPVDAAHLLGVPARAGPLPPAPYVRTGSFGAFASAAQVLGHFPLPVLVHLVPA